MRFQYLSHYISSLSVGISFVSSAAIPPVRRDFPDYYIRNLNTISQIYDFTVYPKQLPIIAQVVSGSIPELAALFNPNVAGRIQDVGSFTNFRTSIEYFYGLAPTPYAPSYLGFSSAEVTQFSSSCDSVASSTVVFTISVVDPSQPNYGTVVTYLKQTGFWHFDDQGRVDYYDLLIPGVQDFCSILNGADFNQKTVQLLATKQICQAAQQVCTGPNTQYPPNAGVTLAKLLSVLGLNPLLDTGLISQLGLGQLDAGGLNCFVQLWNKGFGTFDKLWDDTVTCRIVHLVLAKADPVEHCVHVGPTGGGKCVSYPYNQRLFGDEALFGSTNRFQCPG
ncbi:hypothetical protein TWF694_005981 [Orbilia ellipsospora]|uniref:Uncharacterized protein n=1 Tax=Orbilia ellipsospora TaxID=2528407 RepID=A0AAV9WQV0_9PEZI